MRNVSAGRLLAIALLMLASSGCGVLDWLGKHPPANNPAPVPPPVRKAIAERWTPHSAYACLMANHRILSLSRSQSGARPWTSRPASLC
jgi:hypothetical protein